MTALDLPSQASLAALPPRDKRRVATLIQQLLRVSEEHQRAAERWEAERREQRATIARHEATIAGLRTQQSGARDEVDGAVLACADPPFELIADLSMEQTLLVCFLFFSRAADE